jgi:hypothetical protein
MLMAENPQPGPMPLADDKVFAAAMTRYLKPVYAAEPVGMEDFLRRRILESDHGK